MTEAPYGTWQSAISAADVFATANAVQQVRASGGIVYWLEYRSDRGGACAVMRRGADGRVDIMTPEGMNVRSRVHEYGGAAFMAAGDTVYFSNFGDQRLYVQTVGGEPRPITPESDSCLRYADCTLDSKRGRLICVREDHRGDGEAENTLVAIDIEAGGEGDVLVSGPDFVAAPVLGPDGARLAWKAWDHPNMPWDDTALLLADLGADGRPVNARAIPKPHAASLVQPMFAPDGTLYFIADFSGWWNLYRWTGEAAEPVHRKTADFAGPDWGFGARNYAFLDHGRAITSFTEGGYWRLGVLDLASGDLTPFGPRYAGIGNVARAGAEVWFTAGTEVSSERIYRLTSALEVSEVYAPEGPELDRALISLPEAIEFPTGDGETAYGFFHAPSNPEFEGPEDRRPPLIVKVHGGPTGAASAGLDAAIQFWTSRGFAVLDLNHRGSTGRGRAFRESLYGAWGVKDVEDAARGARWLGQTGRADGARLAIRGGSAGGFTTLAALAFHDVFAAGASYYGVSDLERLALETHKFESRYLDQLIGPYPAAKALYQERSPIHHTGGIQVPLLLFQGLDDEVVPPNQSVAIFEALKANGVPTAYIPFEGEGHGFRKPANKISALETELAFYGEVFGFTPAGDANPVALENWPLKGD